jgi:hypothetical protein
MQCVGMSLGIAPESKEDQEIIKLFEPDTDILVYSGDIDAGIDDLFINFVDSKKSGKRVFLFFCTYGGDADASYKMARYLKTKYEKLTLCVLGNCKSAGTLFALGADDIAMGITGEFGPLDVQMFKPDEFLRRSSGLAITQALTSISKQAFDTWEEVFLKVRARSGGVITTKTAADIASALAVGIYSPISDKIDPARIGEMQRSMDIAMQYGIRLGADEDVIRHLSSNYPSHSFVIDFKEAKALLKSVREPNLFELLLAEYISGTTLEEFSKDILRYPDEDGFIANVKVSISTKKEGKKDEAGKESGKKTNKIGSTKGGPTSKN